MRISAPHRGFPFIIGKIKDGFFSIHVLSLIYGCALVYVAIPRVKYACQLTMGTKTLKKTKSMVLSIRVATAFMNIAYADF